MDEKRSHAVSVAVIFPISGLAAAMYTGGGHVPLTETLWLCGGAAAGGAAGALCLRRVGKKLLGRVFTLLMLAGGIRMLF